MASPHEPSLAHPAVPAEGLSTLARRAAGVLGSHAGAALLGIASLPVLARALGPGEYGRLSLFLTLLGVVTYQDFLRPLLVRALADEQRDDVGVRALSACVSVALGGIAAIGGLLVFDARVALLFAGAVLAHGLASVDYARLALDGRVARAALVRNAAWGLAVVAAALIASARPGHGLAAVAAPFCAANVAILLVYRTLVGRRAAPAWSVRTLRDARDAWREHRAAIGGLVGFGLANALVVSADRLVAVRFLDADDFGLYAGCADLASKLAIVGTAVGTVLYPSFARRGASPASEAESRRFVAIGTRVLCAWAAVVVLLVAGSGAIVRAVLGPEYASGAWICAALFAASFVHMLGFLVTPWQRARGEFAAQTACYAVAGGAMLLVGWALVPLLGLAGAVLCACTARTAEILLFVGEARSLSRRALTPARMGALGAIAATVALFALWRAQVGT